MYHFRHALRHDALSERLEQIAHSRPCGYDAVVALSAQGMGVASAHNRSSA